MTGAEGPTGPRATLTLKFRVAPGRNAGCSADAGGHENAAMVENRPGDEMPKRIDGGPGRLYLASVRVSVTTSERAPAFQEKVELCVIAIAGASSSIAENARRTSGWPSTVADAD